MGTAENIGTPAAMRLRARRLYYFNRARRIGDLVAFADIADWLAIVPGSLDRDEDRRKRAFIDLRDAIWNGEFGPVTKPALFWLPHPPPTVSVGRYPLRLYPANLLAIPDLLTDLSAPRAMMRRWCETRRIPLPPVLHTAPPAVAARPAPRTDSTVEAAFEAWRRTYPHDRQPTRREADQWAKDNNHLTTAVRALHAALEKPAGRPRKRAG